MRPSGARVHVVWKVKMQERDTDRSSQQISAQLEWANSSSPPCAATPPATWRRGGCHGACGPSQFHLTHTLTPQLHKGEHVLYVSTLPGAHGPGPHRSHPHVCPYSTVPGIGRPGQ